MDRRVVRIRLEPDAILELIADGPTGSSVLYATEDGEARVLVAPRLAARVDGEPVWDLISARAAYTWLEVETGEQWADLADVDRWARAIDLIAWLRDTMPSVEDQVAQSDVRIEVV